MPRKEYAKLLDMKKVLLIMLLVLLPFQISWAMAGEHCQDESGPVATHFGHHVHHHQSKLDPPDPKHTEKPSKIHPDCGSCHTTVLALFMEPSLAPALSLSASKPPPFPPDSYTSHVPDGPHKPDRSHFV